MFGTVMQFLSIVLAVALPAFLVSAVRAKDERSFTNYTALVCVSSGIIVFTIIATINGS